MAKEKEEKESGLSILSRIYGYGAAHSASLLAEYKLDEKAIATAFESGGAQAVSDVINAAADKLAAELEAAKKAKPAPAPAQ